MKGKFARTVFAAVLCLALASRVGAQALYGSLVGNVTDETGAAVPGATVTATQSETNLTREVITNAQGAYSIPNIPSGTYTIVITLPGFQTFTARDVIVTNRDVRMDGKLAVGTLKESVTVSAAAPLLQTENAAVRHVTTSDQLQTLPTSGRAFQSFMTLMPGVAQPNYQQAGGVNNPGRTMAIEVNGQPATNTVVRLDGVRASNQYLEGLQSYGPGLEAIETVSIVTNSFDAEEGTAGGASVNVQVKSGTNLLKGSAFESATDARMRARDYFLPPNQDKGTSSVHVFGGTVGGPILRDKLFFFLSDETTRQRSRGGNPLTPGLGASGYISLPPADLRRGDFSNTGTVIYDPLTGNTATGAGRVPFAFANCPGLTSVNDPSFAACNYIPANRINPISAAMLSKLVTPTLPGYANNFFVTPGYDSTYHKIDGKITYSHGPRLTLNARLGFLPSGETYSGILPSVDGQFNPLSQGRVWDSLVNSHSVSATSTLSSNFVVDGVIGFTRHNVNVFPETSQCAGDSFGIPNACQPPYSLDTAIPNFNVTGWTLNGLSQVRDYVDSQWEASGNFAWSKGAHNVKFGLDYVNMQQNHYETQVQEFVFNGGVTALAGGPAPNNFNRFASFLLGLPSSRSGQAMTPVMGEDASAASVTDNQWRPATLRSAIVGTYIRDQWNITPKITASVGVRWEYYSLPRRKDHGLEVYDFATNQLRICGVGPNDDTCGVTVEKNLFTPRLGIAYRPTETLVIRAGYSRNPQSNNPGRLQMPPDQAFPQTVVIMETAPNSLTAVGDLSEGAPRAPQIDLSSGVLALPRGAGVNTFGDTFVRGKIASWNVTVQKALSERLSAQIGYVANRQNGMMRLRNVNYGQLGGGTASQPLSALGIVSPMNVYSPDDKVTYDSMQLSVNRRMSNGAQFAVAYTYSKTMNWWASAMVIPIPEYWHLNKAETGRPHRLNVSAVYELPFGAGKKWLSDEGLLSKLAGGWQVNAFFRYESGTPVTVMSNASVLNAPGTTLQFADQVKDGDVEVFGDACPTCQYFDVSAFRSVTEARFGNAGQNSLRGPSAPNLDMSLFRLFRLGRDKTLQLRVECFNVTNTPHFSNPATNISNVVFNDDGSIRSLNGVGGIISTDRTGRMYDEREWRLGLRFGF